MRSKRWIMLLGMTAAAALALAAMACGGGGGGSKKTATATVEETTPSATAGGTPQASTIVVNLTEYIVAPAPKSAAAGAVTFNAKNIGGTDHELVVIKTELAPDALPTKSDGSADEAGQGVQVIGTIPSFVQGSDQSITLSLDAGSYVLICNVVQQTTDGETVSHYAKEMRAAFQVTQ